ncbi:MAG: hypothetical protein JW829_18135 [Pirellulales bacterium]|nr:hypothetical protein [Pirellulales bacterium]
MIHFTCDGCGRSLNPEFDVRYVVRMEIYASLDPSETDLDDDCDHLQDIQDILERLDDADDTEIGEDVYQQVRYDLCSECRKRFSLNPLGRLAAPQFGFSEN